MPFQEIGRFDTQYNIQRKHDFKRPVTFYDRVRFVGPNGSVEILGGELTGNVTITGDLSSASWDGGTDLSGGRVAATAGYFLDYSADAAQFFTLYADSGELRDLDITGTLEMTTGSTFRTGPDTGARMEIERWTGGAVNFPLAVYTDDSEESQPGGFSTFDTGASWGQTLWGPTFSETASPNALSYGYITWSHFTTTSQGVMSITQYVDEDWDALVNVIAQQAAGTGDAQVHIRATNSGSGEERIGLTAADGVFLDGNLYFGSVLTHSSNDYIAFNDSSDWFLFYVDGFLAATLGDTGLRVVDGTASVPSISFGNDSNTGIYRSGTDQIAFTANGSRVWYLGTTAFRSPTSYSAYIRTAAGSAGAPVYTFADDTDSGWYRNGANQMRWSAGGTNYFEIDHGNNRVSVYNAGFAVGVSSGTGLTDNYIYNTPPTSASSANTLWINATGSIYYLARSTSSARYKKDIEPYDLGDKVLGVEVVEFETSLDGEWTGERKVGVIAEQVYEVFPEAVILDEEGRPDEIDWNVFAVGLLTVLKKHGTMCRNQEDN